MYRFFLTSKYLIFMKLSLPRWGIGETSNRPKPTDRCNKIPKQARPSNLLESMSQTLKNTDTPRIRIDPMMRKSREIKGKTKNCNMVAAAREILGTRKIEGKSKAFRTPGFTDEIRDLAKVKKDAFLKYRNKPTRAEY